MKILVIGSGAREHAITWKLKQSKRVSQIYCVPGNGGTARTTPSPDVNPDDFQSLAEFSKKENIDLTIVGPEAPLAKGIVDVFSANGLKIFGPNKKAALLESDKAWAKGFCRRNNLPTANYVVTDEFSDALRLARGFQTPVVIKASGLAAGKGVIICNDQREVKIALQKIMIEKAFGDSARVVIEDFLQGEELSVMAFCDGKTILPLAPTQDHKRLYDGDKGPNTGGMGAYGPPVCFNKELAAEIEMKVFRPFLEGLKKDAIDYKGIIYFGLMLTANGPMILEFNVRLGDPETQVVMPLLEADLVDVVEAALEGKLEKFKDEINFTAKKSACCVVMASGGYPNDYEKNKIIEGLEEASKQAGTVVFHAGTVLRGENIFSSGGRVLGVTSWADTLSEANAKAYKAVSMIRFDKMYFRKDIAWRSLAKI